MDYTEHFHEFSKTKGRKKRSHRLHKPAHLKEDKITLIWVASEVLPFLHLSSCSSHPLDLLLVLCRKMSPVPPLPAHFYPCWLAGWLASVPLVRLPPFLSSMHFNLIQHSVRPKACALMCTIKMDQYLCV